MIHNTGYTLFNALKKTKTQILIIALLTFLVYANSLSNGLVWDDHLFLEQWPQIQSLESIQEIFQGSAPPDQGKIFRPLRGLFWALDYQIFGVNPLGYRVQAILIHLASTLLVYFIAKQLTSKVKKTGLHLRGGEFLPFVASLLFGLHPIHTETIDYISASLETFGTLFFFLSFWLYLKARNTSGESTSKVKKMGLHLRGVILAGSAVAAFIAFYTYEMTLTLPILLLVYELINIKTVNLKSLFVNRFLILSPYFLAALSFISIRVFILGIVSRTDYLGYSFYHTMLAMVKVFARYIGLLILPINQTAIHNLVGDFPSSMIPYDSLEPILSQTIFDTPVILSVVLHVFLIATAIRYFKKIPLLSFGILWFYITLLPVSYIIPHGGAMAEKYLYIPSFGFLLILAYLIFNSQFLIFNKNFKFQISNLPLIITAIILMFYSTLTIQRNTIWKNDITLFSDVVKKSPNNLLANYTLGIWYGIYGQLDLASKHYLKAIEKAPQFWEARYNLGNTYLRKSEFDKAKEEYSYVLNINPKHKPVQNLLNNLPLAKSASPSALFSNPNLMVEYSPKTGLKFSFPAYWSVVELRKAVSEKTVKTGATKLLADEAVGISVESPDGLKIQIIEGSLAALSMEEYIEKKGESHGKLINQGLAQVPNVEKAYVRIFDDNGVGKLQFFLFHPSASSGQEGKVVQIIVYPISSPSMPIFDAILGSIRLY